MSDSRYVPHLIIGGPKGSDGKWVAIDGMTYKVAELDLDRRMDIGPQDPSQVMPIVPVKETLYYSHRVQTGYETFYFLSPQGEGTTAAMKRLFDNYRPREEEDAV